MPDAASQRPIPSDFVFATTVLGPTRILATFYWARYMHHGKPLVMCDYDVGPLTQSSWRDASARLDELVAERRSRLPVPMGVFAETDVMVQMAMSAGVISKAVPSHLVADESWQVMCQSASIYMKRGDVGYTEAASSKMDRRPFLNEAGVAVGPRTEDPTIAAFLYGVVVGLDPVLARDPKPRPPKRASRN